jgi:hypothetical protein
MKSTRGVSPPWVRYYSPDVFPSLWKQMEPTIKKTEKAPTGEIDRMVPRRFAGAHGATGPGRDKKRRRAIVSLHGRDRKGPQGTACKAAGCPGALVHDMRRSAVRTFERAGVPRSVAMSIVGHRTESIYRRYAIVDEAMQREAAARLDAWMVAPSTPPSTATVTALRRGSRGRGRVTG